MHPDRSATPPETDTAYAEIEFIIMGFNLATILRASVCQYADEPHFHRRKEGKHPIIQQISASNGRLGCVQLGGGPLG
jgi:hypothetical protein